MSDLEYLIAEFLVVHKEEISKEIKELLHEAKTNPILSTYIKEAELDAVISYLVTHLNMPYENIATAVDNSFMEKYLGM